jgi:hypothetical protein
MTVDPLEDFIIWVQQRRARRRLFWRAAGHLALALGVSLGVAAGMWLLLLLAAAHAEEAAQYLPPPCDIPGLSQVQYDICYKHAICANLTRFDENGKLDGRSVRYEQCLKINMFKWTRSQPTFRWIIDPNSNAATEEAVQYPSPPICER